MYQCLLAYYANNKHDEFQRRLNVSEGAYVSIDASLGVCTLPFAKTIVDGRVCYLARCMDYTSTAVCIVHLQYLIINNSSWLIDIGHSLNSKQRRVLRKTHQ